LSDRFDNLVGGLNAEERKALLARILSSQKTTDFQEPVFVQEDGRQAVSPQEAYASLSLFQKILLALQSLFRGRKTEELLTERLLAQLRGRVSRSAPGLLDFHEERILGRLVDEVDELRAPLAYLRETVGEALKDPQFLAYLADLELDPLPRRLWAETDPAAIYQEPACTEEAEIKSEALFRFERIVTHIPTEDRERVYRDAQAVEALAALAALRIEELAVQLSPNGSPTTFADAGRKLRPLCDRLAAVRLFPSPTAWQALHLHARAAGGGSEAPEEEQELSSFLGNAHAATSSVRDFLRRVPLVDVLKLLNGDLSYVPKPAAGGEKWYALFKDCWERRLQKRFASYARERRRHAWKEEAAAYCEIPRLTPAEHYAAARFGALYVPRYPDSLSFLRSFHDAVFVPRMERNLKLVYINGEFYKPDNRAAYTDSFDGFVEVCRRAVMLDGRLSPEGDLGKVAYAGVAETAGQEARTAARTALETADAEARKIVDDALRHMKQLSRILHGILYGEVGGEYDTLANLGSIGGRENKAIRAGVDAALRHLENAYKLLAEVKDLEGA